MNKEEIRKERNIYTLRELSLTYFYNYLKSSDPRSLILVNPFQLTDVIDAGEKNLSLAIECSKRVIKLFPDFWFDWLSLGSQYREAILGEKALECYQKALELNPTISLVYNHIGQTYSMLNDHEKSIHYSLIAVGLNPNNSLNWSNLGLSYKLTKQYEKVTPCCEKAIELDPNNPFVNGILSSLPKKYQRTPSSRTTSEKINYQQIAVNSEEIQKIKNWVADKKRIKVRQLESITGMSKGKILKILTEYLDFELEIDTLIFVDKRTPGEKHKQVVEQVKQAIGSKKEVDLDYLRVITKISKDKLVGIIENDLGLTIKDNKVIGKN